MTNPYSQQAPAPLAEGDRPEKFKFNKIGDGIQGIIVRQSPWMDDKFNKTNKVRYIDVNTVDGERTIVIKSPGQKRAIGDVLTEKSYTDTEVGMQFGMKFVSEVPTDKGNPFKVYEAFVNKP